MYCKNHELQQNHRRKSQLRKTGLVGRSLLPVLLDEYTIGSLTL